jgi:hypothetical protein
MSKKQIDITLQADAGLTICGGLLQEAVLMPSIPTANRGMRIII